MNVRVQINRTRHFLEPPVVIEVVMAVSDLTRDTPEEKRIDREEYECVDEADRGDAEVEDAPLHWVHYPALTI